jgi:hypothetical protein
MSRLVAMIPLLGVLAAPAAAQTPECYCLRDRSGNMLYGCEAHGDRHICDDRGRITMVPIRSEWTPLACGCGRPDQRSWEPHIRGDEDDAKDKGGGQETKPSPGQPPGDGERR